MNREVVWIVHSSDISCFEILSLCLESSLYQLDMEWYLGIGAGEGKQNSMELVISWASPRMCIGCLVRFSWICLVVSARGTGGNMNRVSQNVMSFYTDDSPGIKIPPVSTWVAGSWSKYQCVICCDTFCPADYSAGIMDCNSTSILMKQMYLLSKWLCRLLSCWLYWRNLCCLKGGCGCNELLLHCVCVHPPCCWKGESFMQIMVCWMYLFQSEVSQMAHPLSALLVHSLFLFASEILEMP